MDMSYGTPVALYIGRSTVSYDNWPPQRGDGRPNGVTVALSGTAAGGLLYYSRQITKKRDCVV